MKNKKDLFDLFRESEHKLEPTPSRHAWDKLERKLDARKDINQTSKYRSIAMVAAVVAVVSIASVIVLLNFDDNKNNAMAGKIMKDTNTWEEIALEKSAKNGDDLVAFNKSVEKKQVLMNEGSADKKLVPTVNRGKSATNKIQNYKQEDLAGTIDLATNTYEMHESPLEREMLLGEVTINKNTTADEIAEKAFGKNNNTNGEQSQIAEVEDEVESTPATIVMADMTTDDMEGNYAENVVVPTMPMPTTPASSVPKYKITEINAPSAKTDVVVGEADNEFFRDRMDQISAADRRLEESVAEASTKVTKKKKSRDIFKRDKASRQSSSPIAPSSVGIAANATAAKESNGKDMDAIPNLTWLMGQWKDVDNDVKKEWTLVGRKDMAFQNLGTTNQADFKISMHEPIALLTDKHSKRSYRYLNTVGEKRIFINRNDDVTYVIEILKSDNQFILSSYQTSSEESVVIEGTDVEKLDLEERVFVKL